MKTYLIFKRQETRDDVTKVVTKIVPVDIPSINSGEGWILSGHTDVIDVVSENSSNVLPSDDQTKKEAPVPLPTKFDADVQGTAKLVKVKGFIKIVARRGKSTYNQTTPSSVCVSDLVKNKFFEDCRAYHGRALADYSFKVEDGSYYTYWSTYMEKEYKRQQLISLSKKESK